LLRQKVDSELFFSFFNCFKYQVEHLSAFKHMLLIFVRRFYDAKFHCVAILGPPSVERLSFELVLSFLLCLRVYS
jgi:hypothetical protein